ncbi:hypothetical protein [Streptomyces sp. MAI_2237]
MNFSGAIDVMVVEYDVERTLSLRWTDADSADPADRTITWTWNRKAAERVSSL